MKIKYYARYVDDFIIFSNKKKNLKDIMFKIKKFLIEELNLMIHPNKIYLQNIIKGFDFLGVIIKPWRSYASSRVKSNFWITIGNINTQIIIEGQEKNKKKKMLSKINSHLGVLRHCNSYNLKKKMLNELNKEFWRNFVTGEGFMKVVFKKKCKKKRKTF